MNTFSRKALLICISTLFATPVLANDSETLKQLKAELESLRKGYESRLADLESRLRKAESAPAGTAAAATPAANPAMKAGSPAGKSASGTGFNPNVSLILSGTYANLQRDPSTWQLSGFVPGGEIGPGSKSFSLGESELGISANIDHLFYGAANFAITGEDEIEVEEAFIQTTAMPAGLQLKGGRFFSDIGYQNTQHAHTWDFVDAPLVYQGIFGGQYKQDGVQLSWVAPSSIFFQLGGEAGRGAAFPGSDHNSNKAGAAAVFARIGGDLDASNNWRAGLSWLRTSAMDREYETSDLLGNTVNNAFTGKSNILGADFVWKWAPQGNATHRNFKLQGEYFRRKESGDLNYDTAAAAAIDSYRSKQSGWYLQGVYQFMPAWRVGVRYDRLNSGSVDFASNNANLENSSYDPSRSSIMVDWSPSEFSRIRLQYAKDKSRQDQSDNQIFLQYQMSLGAHGAHAY